MGLATQSGSGEKRVRGRGGRRDEVGGKEEEREGEKEEEKGKGKGGRREREGGLPHFLFVALRSV